MSTAFRTSSVVRERISDVTLFPSDWAFNMRWADDQIRLIRANPLNPRYQRSKALSVWITDDADLTGSHEYYFTMVGGSLAS